jgi:hypothetical protein
MLLHETKNHIRKFLLVTALFLMNDSEESAPKNGMRSNRKITNGDFE